MNHVFHRQLKTPLPVLSHGQGSYLVDRSGKRYLDACGGAAVSSLGHSYQPVRDAIIRQVEQAAYAHNSFFTNQPAEELADYLVDKAPAGFGNGKAMFVSSGSEAMEAALKLARQYHLERGDPKRERIIARHGSYHGYTLGALAVGGHAGRRAPFEPILFKAEHIDPCYAYRYKRDDETDAEFGRRMADLLEEKLQRIGPETVAAFVAEPVVGATLGTVPAASGYFRRIREICDRHGVLFIADEVMCGMGRTGTLFALEQEGVSADLITIAKGLGAGYQPVAALLVAEPVCDAVKNGSGLLWNGHTYMSHAVACAGAMEVMRQIELHGLMEVVRQQGDKFDAKLKQRFGQHPYVGDVRGRGLFRSIELVKDRETKEPFAAELNAAGKIKAEAFERGLMCYPQQGCAGGREGDHVLLAPPFTVADNELDEVVDLLAASVDQVLKSVSVPV